MKYLLIDRKVKVIRRDKKSPFGYYNIGMKGIIKRYDGNHRCVINWEDYKRFPHNNNWYVDRRDITCVYKNCKGCKYKIECVTS